jgi:putative ABC transport system substrate-binding protein
MKCPSDQPKSIARDLWKSMKALLALLTLILVNSGDGHAQQTKVPRIGYLSPADTPGPNHRAFLERLAAEGFEDGKTVKIEWRWARQRYDQLADAALELAASRVDVLIAQTQAAALAAKQATSTIPIVFVGVRDPVAAGLVKSVGRPDGNITGVTLTPNAELAAKQVQLVRELRPEITNIGVFWNPAVVVQSQVVSGIRELSRSLGIAIVPYGIQKPGDIEAAFTSMSDDQVQAVITLVESFTLQRRKQIADLAIEKRVPTIFEVRDYVDAGGLLSYGVQYHDHYARAAAFVARILRGALPKDLPIELPRAFDFVINLRTAKALDLQIPSHFLMQASEVIENP